MGEDEVLVLVLSGLGGVSMLLWWLMVLGVQGPKWRSLPRTFRRAVAALPLLSLLLVHLGLGWFADVYVQGDWRYRLQYDAMGLLWVMMGLWALGQLGLWVAGEVAMRANRAAGIAGAGAALGLTATYLGGNVGEGPGWPVVVFSSGLATSAWLLGWWAIGTHGHAADRITIDHHEPTAWRTAGLLTAVGMVLGRAVAGDWVSASDTALSFVAQGWVAAVFVAIEVAWVRAAPAPYAPNEPGVLNGGIVPGLFWVAMALSWVLLWPHPNPVMG